MTAGAWDGYGNYIRMYRWTTDLTNKIPVTAKRVDDEFDAICAALGNCVTRDGQGGTTGPVIIDNGAHFNDGSTALPSITFKNDLNTGIYRDTQGIGTNDNLGISAAGLRVINFSPNSVVAQVTRFDISKSIDGTVLARISNSSTASTSVASGVEFTSGLAAGAIKLLNDPAFLGGMAIGTTTPHSLTFQANSVTIMTMRGDGAFPGILPQKHIRALSGAGTYDHNFPAYSFAGDENSGFYRWAGDALGISVGGAASMLFQPVAVTVKAPQIWAQSGTQALPSYVFDGDPDTGMYRVTDNGLGFSLGGTIMFSMLSTVVTCIPPIRSSVGYGASTPNYSWTSDIDSGMYRYAAGTIGFSTSGTPQVTISDSAMSIIGAAQFRAAAGSLAAPPISFVADPVTGFYRPAASSIAVISNSAEIARFAPAAITTAQPIRAAAGSAAFPTYSFSGTANDNATGIYRYADGVIGFVASGVAQVLLSDSYMALPGGAQFRATYGTSGLPGISFNGDAVTGFYRAATGVIGVSGTLQMSNTIQAATGTGTSPNILPGMSFSGDTNTGIHSPGGDTLNVVAGGVVQASFGVGGYVTIGPTNQLLVTNSAFAFPGYAFVSDTTTGLYHGAAGTVGLSVTQSWKLEASANSIKAAVPILAPASTNPALPSIGWDGDAGLGFYRPASGTIGIAGGGLNMGTISSTIALFSGVIRSNGASSVSAPHFSFGGETNTGFYRYAAGAVAIAGLGQQLARFDVSGAQFPDGSRLYPSITFFGSRTVGFWLNTSSPDVIAVASQDKDIAFFGPNGVIFGPQVSVSGATPATIDKPQYCFYTDENTGIYHPSDATMNLVSNGVAKQIIGPTGCHVIFQSGSAAVPSICFDADASRDTGIFWGGENCINFTCGSNIALSLINAGAYFNGKLNLATNANATPQNGDVWFDGTNLRLRVGSTSYTLTKV